MLPVLPVIEGDEEIALVDPIADGQLLVVIEAMKMEHKITAPTASVVTEVRVAAGQRVDAGDVLVLLDHVDADA